VEISIRELIIAKVHRQTSANMPIYLDVARNLRRHYPAPFEITDDLVKKCAIISGRWSASTLAPMAEVAYAIGAESCTAFFPCGFLGLFDDVRLMDTTDYEQGGGHRSTVMEFMGPARLQTFCQHGKFLLIAHEELACYIQRFSVTGGVCGRLTEEWNTLVVLVRSVCHKLPLPGPLRANIRDFLLFPEVPPPREETGMLPVPVVDRGVIEEVWHDNAETIVSLDPQEAEQIAHEQWASYVELSAAITTSAPAEATASQLVLLSFGHFTQQLNEALLTSPVAAQAGRQGVELQPTWAGGAKVFVAMSTEALRAALPAELVLKPWHVVVYEQDMDLLFQALQHLPHGFRRMNGQMPLDSPADDASQLVNPDADRLIPDVMVCRTFIHYTRPSDTRSVQSW